MSSDSLDLSPGPAAIIAVAGMVSLLATYWDDAWHTDLGRDSATIAPHVLLYGSVAVAGLVVAGWGVRLLVTTRSVRLVLRQRPFLVAAVAGAGTLVAAPIDAGWHEAFGRDAVLWSPPHMLVVCASTAMVVAVLAAVGPTRRGIVEAMLASLLLGSLTVSVMEYQTDVPQFPEVFYLPVLLAAGLSAAALARGLVPVRAPVTVTVGIYVLLRLATMIVLALLGRSTPEWPLAVLGLTMIDLPWRRGLVRYAAGAAATAALAWAAAVTGWARESVPAVAVVAVPVILAFGAVLIATTRWGRPTALTSLAVIASGAVLLGSAPPAAAHDPGQGEPLASTRLTGISDGRGMLTVTVRIPDCAQITPVEVVARRAGRSLTGKLRPVGDCRYTGSVQVAPQGRWFIYAEFRRGGQAQVWLPMQADQSGRYSETRELYAPARATASTRPVELIAAVAIYALGLSLLSSAIWLVPAKRRASMAR